MPGTTCIEDLREPGALELLHSPDPARLAYTGPDGYPRVIPIGFLWNGTGVVVCTAPTAPKVAALAQQPRVALTIETIGPPTHQGAPATRHRDHRDRRRRRARVPGTAAKSTQGDEFAAFEAAVRSLYKEMARITITPSWARFYDFGAGRLPTFLPRLVEPRSA